MADVASAPQAKTPSGKPERPDEEKYKKELEQAEKELTSAKARYAAVKSKLDMVQSNSKDSPQAQKQTELRQQLAAIRKQQQGHKDSRQLNQDKIKKLDEQIKARIAEQKNARSRVPYKSVDDINREIDQLQKMVDTGTMKLVDEKKALGDISSMHRAKKSFVGFDQAQKGIDDLKAQISDLRKGQEDPEVRALNDKYTSIQKELDEMRKEHDDVYKNLNSLRDERTKAQTEQQEKYTTVKEIKDKFYQARRAARDHEQEQWRQRKEKQAAERAAYESGKRREIASRKLEEASAPAYQEEITSAENLIRHFDPSSVVTKEDTGPSKFAAVAQRTIDDAGIKGTKLPKKGEDQDNYFIGSGSKKGKKGKKGGAASTASASDNKFQLSIDLIEQLARIGVEPPMSQSYVPIVVEKIKEKMEFWKKDQDRKTKENVSKAQKEIERLEAETSPSAPANVEKGAKDNHSKPAAANQGVNGKVSADAELKQERDAVDDAAAELEKAKIEDSKAQT